MRNPIGLVKEWGKPTKRYVLVSVVLTAWLLYRDDNFWFSDLTGFLIVPLMLVLITPVVFFIILVVVDLAHRFIHWLEDDQKLA